MQVSAVESGAMASQDRVILALLPIKNFFSTTDLLMEKQREKRNTEHEGGIAHADSLLQSPLTYDTGVPPYTTFSPQSVATTRRFLHVTTLSCLPLDINVDSVAVHDGNVTEGFFHAGATCWRHTTPAKQT